MVRSASDWAVVLVAFAAMIAVNVLSSALPIAGITMPEISAKYGSLFTPAGFTFGIWGVIYLLLLVFAVYQALPAQRDNASIAGISGLFIQTCVANAVWIVVWHYEMIAVALLIMLYLLVTLVRIFRRLHDADLSLRDKLLVRLPFSIYTGWITLATIANISALQTATDTNAIGLSYVTWTLIKLAVVAAIGASVLRRYGDIAFVLVAAWAAWGISAMQTSTPAVSGAALMLSIAALMLAGWEFVGKMRSAGAPG